MAADDRAVEDDRAHADEGLVAYGAAMEDRAVAHGDAAAHGHGVAKLLVEDAVVLDVGVVADGDGLAVATEHRAEKHAAARADPHVAHHGGVGRDIGVGVDDRGLHSSTPRKNFSVL